MPKQAGKYVQVVLSEPEALTLDLVLQACIEAGADRERIEPIMRRLESAMARLTKRRSGDDTGKTGKAAVE